MGYDRGDSFRPEKEKENSHHDHIPFNMKGNGNEVFSVYRVTAQANAFITQKIVGLER